MHKQSLIILSLLINWSVFSQTSLKIGDKAPEITLKGKDGDVIKLSESTGSLTIVHFWASWSKPCKPMNQYLSQAYSKYKKEGLEIFSVSIDKKPRTWFEAIENQKLNWPNHVSDFKGMVYSKPAKDYKIYEVPSIFVLDEKGMIQMINPTQDELIKKLKTLDNELKILPQQTSNFVYFTKRTDYLIYDSTDTLVLGGKGNSAYINKLDTGTYRLETTEKSFYFKKILQDTAYDFQINYQSKQITFITACSYEIRSKNGNLLLKGEGDYIDYSILHLKNKDDFFLILPNSAHELKLY